MKRNIVYVLGLLEDQEDPLFQYLQNHTPYDVEYHHIAPFSIDTFGTQSFNRTIKQVQDFINTLKPEIIVAHSLGAYVTMNISIDRPLILLDPSLAISDIIKPNIIKYNGTLFYDDGTYRIKLSQVFLESLPTSHLKEIISGVKIQEVHIFGAGKGGCKIAEKYHQCIPHSHYLILPSATHKFEAEHHRQQILTVIKKWLDIKSSHEGDTHTKSW